MLEKTKIINGKLGAATLLQNRDLKNIASIFNTKEDQYLIKGEIPSELVYLDIANTVFIWRCELQKAELYYKDELNIENGIRPIPKLLFKFKSNELHVYAYKKWEGLKQTKLFHAPFHNVYENGRICMGSVKMKIQKMDTFDSFIKRLQFLFFRNPGSEIHNTKMSNINTFHIALKECNSFPISQLVPYEGKCL